MNMNKQEKLSLYDELLINLTDFICIVSENDILEIRSIIQMVTDYKIKIKQEIENKK